MPPSQEHQIWKIGLFTKLSKEKAQCNVCKESGREKHTFELSNGSIKSLIVHLNTKNHAEYLEKYQKIQRLKESEGSKMISFLNSDSHLYISGLFFTFKTLNSP